MVDKILSLTYIEYVFNEYKFNNIVLMKERAMGTRDEQKEQRYQLIIMKALELFVKKGYRETKVSDIAKAANMSTGLMFHYFESKEQLYEALVKMGLEGTKSPGKMEINSPVEYFSKFLDQLFTYTEQQPWVVWMFVLMFQARRGDGVPEHIKELAMQVNQVEESARIIEKGQAEGYFREGDPHALAYAFWSSVQGIMEQMAVIPDMPLPKTEWIMNILIGD